MSARITARRRGAFLRALAASGNVTASAERAKVSRAWVVLHRGRDAAFDRECREALAAFAGDGRAAPGPGSGRECNAPPAGWKYLDGVELVVRGSGGSGGGRRVQIARARVKQWTPRVEKRFLAVLMATCNVRAAYSDVGMSKSSAYNHRRRWPGFARCWDAAVEEGYQWIEMDTAWRQCNLYSDPELPDDPPAVQMTIAQAIHVMSMHKHQVRGSGRPPGVRKRAGGAGK